MNESTAARQDGRRDWTPDAEPTARYSRDAHLQSCYEQGWWEEDREHRGCKEDLVANIQELERAVHVLTGSNSHWRENVPAGDARLIDKLLEEVDDTCPECKGNGLFKGEGGYVDCSHCKGTGEE